MLCILASFLFPLPDTFTYSKIVTDESGTVIHAYLTPDEKWRMKTALSEISPSLQKAIIEKEDKWFYYHPGVNPLALVRALFKNLFSGKRTSGASTITMQVARALEPKKRTYVNKLVEIFRAFQLEWKYPKREILQLYLNLAPYGGNIEGVKAAAILYFGKNPNHLSLAELMALSVIPNRPSSLVMGKNNEQIILARNKWLMRFKADKVFSDQEIADAVDEPLTAKRLAAPRLVPHLAYKLSQTGEEISHSHINLNTQLKTEKLVKDYVRTLTPMNIRNAAVIIIDNPSRQVVTYVGSADYNDSTDAGQVNGAAAIRQPGSTLKPLLYGLCLDAGLMTPKTVLTDVAVNYNGYAPENYDKQFNGYVTMEYALEHSLNIPAVKSLRALGKDKFVHQLVTCNFEQVRKDQGKLGLSLILGGCGTTLEELTALFSIFAHDGDFITPEYSRKAQKAVKKRILSPASAFMINEMLSKVNRPDFPLNWFSTEKMPRIAWKTGTSYGRRDAWSIGYNQRFTIGVWVGNFSGLGVSGLSGAEIATPLLFRIFNTVDYDSDNEWFRQPADCGIRKVCNETGLQPGEYCTNLVTDYFIPLVSSSQLCEHVQEIMVDPREKISYCKSCMPAGGYKKILYTAIAPEMQAWMDEHKVLYKKIPPHNPACEKIFREGSPLIVSPSANAEYLIDRSNPEPLQLACHAAADVAKVFWYINDQFYKTTGTRSKIFFMPSEGPVKISCTDDKGRNRDIWIRVKFIGQ
ncbi:penicillin-binding protein 1C [Flavihumibacter profundi]|jgi:penicillin-binding protein 1C|uniref:penicillin-binding protein 1C n=1 Tax=Flavihumibacter profundi TaxID=2716883 RepID=UPI001CC674C2|nr:penicillin-binding protein 1C [Flavihumibacter profundi]MBZ5857658.1 penicillin-binding protein 1C [Flavihumibacter profundi]